MAITISNVLLDGPSAKCFDILVPEVDVVGVNNGTVVFGAGGMRNFDAAPMVKWIVNITANAAAPTGSSCIGIYGPTIFGFEAIKTSAATVAAVSQTYRVWMFSKLFGEF